MPNMIHTPKTQLPAEPANQGRAWDYIYGGLFLIAFMSCLLLGVFYEYTSYLALVFLVCAAASFFSDYYYLYLAMFMYVRNRAIISTIPAFEIYAYLMILKVLLEHYKLKLRVFYLPVLMILLIHTLFAATRVDMAVALKLALYLVVVYLTLSKVLADDSLMRKFLVVFMMGAIVSGIYGYTAADTVKDIRVAGGGAYEVSRNFGILYDANFACLFYIASIYIALFLKGIPKLLKLVLAGFFLLLLLQTSSLSGMITLSVTAVLAIILKFRKKSVFILAAVLLGVFLLLSIPQVREMEAVAGLLLRLAERLHYIKIGRWDMITTGRTELWEYALELFNSKSLMGKLFGGSVITINLTETTITSFFNACHQSIVQGILNFGIIGTLVIFLSLGSVFLYRVIRHMFRAPGYENEDIKIIQLLISGIYISMSMTIDTFTDWACMLLLFI